MSYSGFGGLALSISLRSSALSKLYESVGSHELISARSELKRRQKSASVLNRSTISNLKADSPKAAQSRWRDGLI